MRYDAFDTLDNLAQFETFRRTLPGDWIEFKNNFVTTSICPSSRASIYSGLRAKNHGIWNFRNSFRPPQFAQSLPALLRAAGYNVGFIGKWGIGPSLYAQEYDYWDGFRGQGDYISKNKDGAHLTDRQTTSAINYINAAPEPFCLIVAYKAPHGPIVTQPRYASLLKGIDLPQPASNTEEHVNALPFALKNSLARIAYVRESQKNFAEEIRNYYRLIAGISDSVTDIAKAMRTRGCYDNSALMVTSDNGLMLGEHGLAGKWCMYEESIRTPLLCKMPADFKTAARRIDGMTLNIDLAPSLLEIAGVAAPVMDGQSFVSLLNGDNNGARSEFMYEHTYTHGNIIPPCYGIRHRDWKYVQYTSVAGREEQYFDLKNDPQERTNQIATLDAKRLNGLREQLAQYRKKK